MENRTDSRPVVYVFVDPAFRWDVSAVTSEAERRGFRVVRGDNADELLFLLQMGRPAAILFTLASPEARTFGGFHMISRRALDMLVPMVIAGPEDPRDGLLLRYPAGDAAEERYVPLHAIGDLLAELDAAPPTTPSRPAPLVEGGTFGKGRTMMAWRRSVPPGPFRVPGAPTGPRPEPATPSQPPDPVDSAPAEPDGPTELYEGGPPPAEDGPGTLRQAVTLPVPPKPRPTRMIAFAVAGGVMLGAGALAMYVATAPGPASVGPPRRIPAANAPAPVIAQPEPPAPEPAAPEPAAPEPAAAPAPNPPAEQGVREEPRPAPEQPFLRDASGAIRFPGRFKDETAMFFFADDGEEERFLGLLRSLGPDTVVRVIGHATFDELKTGPDRLARGRAWAVEKYLVRRGFPRDRIRSEGGLPVRGGSDPDPQGRSLNRWVDIRFE